MCAANRRLPGRTASRSRSFEGAQVGGATASARGWRAGVMGLRLRSQATLKPHPLMRHEGPGGGAALECSGDCFGAVAIRVGRARPKAVQSWPHVCSAIAGGTREAQAMPALPSSTHTDLVVAPRKRGLIQRSDRRPPWSLCLNCGVALAIGVGRAQPKAVQSLPHRDFRGATTRRLQ